MTRMQLDRWRLPFPTAIALAVLGGILPACLPRSAEPPAPPQPGAACRPGVAPSTRAELDACLQGLRFDSAREVSDSQPLTVIGEGAPCPGNASKKCRFGPLAKIEPVKRAQNYSDSELMQGRIIAKLSIPSGEKEGYLKYGLEPGQETFWWVQMDSTGTGGQSVFITSRKDGGVVLQPPRKLTRYVYEEEEKVKRAIARWLWDLDDEVAQGSCGGGSCR